MYHLVITVPPEGLGPGRSVPAGPFSRAGRGGPQWVPFAAKGPATIRPRARVHALRNLPKPITVARRA
jgi:hypothetical protein